MEWSIDGFLKPNKLDFYVNNEQDITILTEV